jgi:hypothetical protein
MNIVTRPLDEHDYEAMKAEKEEREAIEAMMNWADNFKLALQEKRFSAAKVALDRMNSILSDYV